MRILLMVLLLGVSPFLAMFAEAAPPGCHHECTNVRCDLSFCPSGDLAPARPLPGFAACRPGVSAFSIRLNTGASLSGVPYAGGTVDPIWKMAPSGAAYAKRTDLPGAWTSHANAAWINPYSGSTIHGPLTTTMYRATFAVPSNAYDVRVTGVYAADNQVDLSLSPGSFPPYVSPMNAFMTLRPLSWNIPAPGTYSIGATVRNGAPGEFGSFSPTGLLVAATLTGRCYDLVGEALCHGPVRTFRLNLNTGVGPGGVLVPAGSADPRWTSNFPAPSAAWTHPDESAWVGDSSSRWINVNPAGTASLPGVTSTSYQLRYSIPADAWNVVLSGRFAADNGATLSDTDDQQATLVATTPSPYGFASWTSFHQPLTRNGQHTLGVHVTDFGDLTGVNVVATVTGVCGGAPGVALPMDPVALLD